MDVNYISPSSAQNLMIDLLQLLIFSELLPTSVLELIGPSLNSLVLNLSISTSPPPTSLDIIKINLLTVPFCESSSGALNSREFHTSFFFSTNCY